MVFADLIFLYLFLPLNLVLYYLFKSRTYRNFILTVFSLFFYAWGEPVWVVLLIISALVDYINGLVIERCRGEMGADLALLSSLVINLGLLCSFKYSGLIVASVNSLFSTSFDVPSFALPIGISFYTFQTLSYTIDVYRGEVKPQRSFAKFLLFVSLYHQLVAGPIVRYSEIGESIENRHENWADVSKGVDRFVIGLAKKTIVANTAGRIAAPYIAAENISSLSTVGAWFGIILFALQIYYDFSGYSDMAIGLGQMFGFSHPENFRYPYISRGAAEFWRRWHITLGSFFRDYIYIPLGGNRSKMVRNLLITWFVTGLWHGASWNFVIWGVYYGVLILLERLFLEKLFSVLPRIFSHIYFILIMLIGWVFFCFTELPAAIKFLGRMFFIGGPVYDISVGLDIAGCAIWLALSIIFCMPVSVWLGRRLEKAPQGVQNGVAAVRPLFNISLIFICTCMLVGQSYNPFLYFRF